MIKGKISLPALFILVGVFFLVSMIATFPSKESNKTTDIVTYHTKYRNLFQLNRGLQDFSYQIEGESSLKGMDSSFVLSGVGTKGDTDLSEKMSFYLDMDGGKKKEAFTFSGHASREFANQKKAVRLDGFERSYRKFEDYEKMVNQLVQHLRGKRIALSKDRDSYVLTHKREIRDFAYFAGGIARSLSGLQHTAISGENTKINEENLQNINDILASLEAKYVMKVFAELSKKDLRNITYEVAKDDTSIIVKNLTHPYRRGALDIKLDHALGRIGVNVPHSESSFALEWLPATSMISGNVVYGPTSEYIGFKGNIEEKKVGQENRISYEGDILIRLQGTPLFDKYDSLMYEIKAIHTQKSAETLQHENIPKTQTLPGVLQEIQL